MLRIPLESHIEQSLIEFKPRLGNRIVVNFEGTCISLNFSMIFPLILKFPLIFRELICLLFFTCNYVVSVWRGFLFFWVLGNGYIILLWHSLSLPYNYYGYKIICISNHQIKLLCQGINLVPSLVFWDKMLLKYE